LAARTTEKQEIMKTDVKLHAASKLAAALTDIASGITSLFNILGV
jgi:C4-dicarboxylate-specific signal transduction histidine kinase